MQKADLAGPIDHSSEPRKEVLLARYGDGMDGSAPTLDQWTRLLEGAPENPIAVINFFKLRGEARYGAGDEVAEEATSGGEAMMQYAAVSGPALERVGGSFLLMGSYEASLMGEDESWDMVAIGSYPSRHALLELFEDEAYAKAYAHRRAAVERQRVVVVRA